jgi:hypothetical protein
MIVHVPLFNVKLPKSATSVTSVLIDVATFSIPGLDVIGIFGNKSLGNNTEPFKKDIFEDDNGDENLLEKKLD